MPAVATKYMQKRASKLARQIVKWARRDPKTGEVHYYVPASEQEPFEPVRAYKVSARAPFACSCPSHWNRGICSHVLAAQIATPPE